MAAQAVSPAEDAGLGVKFFMGKVILMKVAWILLLLPLVFLAGCGTFRREWRRAVSSPPPDALQGPWEGEWRSEVNGHHGTLRCVIRSVGPEEGDEASPVGGKEAVFHYWARWGIFSGSFQGRYPVERVDARDWRFRGSSDLGWLGGVYTHRGEVREGTFRARYEGAHDRGSMIMRRPTSMSREASSTRGEGQAGERGENPLQSS